MGGWRGIGGHSKHLREASVNADKEKVGKMEGTRERLPRHLREREENNKRRKRNQENEQVGK